MFVRKPIRLQGLMQTLHKTNNECFAFVQWWEKFTSDRWNILFLVALPHGYNVSFVVFQAIILTITLLKICYLHNIHAWSQNKQLPLGEVGPS